MEKNFEIQKIQLERNMVAQKRNLPRKELTLKAQKALVTESLSIESWSDAALLGAVPDCLEVTCLCPVNVVVK